MNTRNKQAWRTFACSVLCASILSAPGACTSQRTWDDASPGHSGPDLADVGEVILGAGFVALYVVAQCAGGGGSSAFGQYSYNSHGWR